jgi:hypothetical protein
MADWEKLTKTDPVRYTCHKMYDNALQRAKRKGYDFNITTNYLIQIAPTYCPVFGWELKYGKGQLRHYSASIDRIEPDRGYVIGNVRIISNLANAMKSNASDEDLRKFAKWVLR